MQRLLYGFLVLLPLLFLPWANQQFELSKFVLTVIAAGLFLFFWANNTIRNKEVSIPMRGITLSASVLLLYLIVHSFFLSFIPDNSIWGSYQRHTGLLLWVSLGVLLVTVIKSSLTLVNQERLLRFMAATGVLAAFVGIIQWLAPAWWGGLASTSGRIYSTLGVPNFLGQWLLMTLILSVYQLKVAKNTSPRILWGAATILQILALVLSGNRASLLILGVLAIVSAVVMLLRMKPTWQKGALASTLLVVLVVLGYGIVSRSDGAFRSLESRSILYPIAVQAITERPLQGFGLDTLYTVYASRLNMNLGETENLQDIPDKVHQAVLDTLAETGVVGLLLFLWLFIEIARLGWCLLNSEDIQLRGQSAAIVVALTAWLLSLLVSFPGVTECVYATVLVGLLIAQNGQTKGGVLLSWRRWVQGLLSVLVGVIMLGLGIGTLVADIKYAHMAHSPVNDPLEDVLAWTPIRLEYEIFGSNNYLAPMALTDRLAHLQNALQKNPQDVWALTFLADVQARMGNYTEAKATLEKAKNACHRCVFVAVEGAHLALTAQDQPAMDAWVAHYLELLPSFLNADPATLTPELQERRRITLKEQQNDLTFMMSLLGGREDAILQYMHQ